MARWSSLSDRIVESDFFRICAGSKFYYNGVYIELKYPGESGARVTSWARILCKYL